MIPRLSITACRGLTLVELMIALMLSGLLLAGLVHFAGAAGAGSRLQDEQALLQDHARLAHRLLVHSVRQAGYNPAPWDRSRAVQAIANGTADGGHGGQDRLVIRSRSDRNCFENVNQDLDSDGSPAFYIREMAFDVSASGFLKRGCLYGPDTGNMTEQIRSQGLVPGVKSFQVLFAEDADADGNIDRWLTAGQWNHPGSIRGVRVGLLMAGEHPVAPQEQKRYRVLDQLVTTRADGKLRLALDFTAAIRGDAR